MLEYSHRPWALTALLVAVTACGANNDPGGEDPANGSGESATGGNGSGGAGASDGGGSGSDSARAPLEECLAPCIWELTSVCHPGNTCIRDTDGPFAVTCDPESGYRHEDNPRALGEDVKVWMNDELCYYISTSRDGNSERYFSPDDVLVGEIFYDNVSEIMVCFDGDESTQYDTVFQSSRCFDYWPPVCADGQCE